MKSLFKEQDILEKEIYRFSTGDGLKVFEAIEGIFTSGNSGGGKSSGPGNHLLHAFLKHKFGGIIICISNEEVKRVDRLIRKAKRESDVVHFHGGSSLSFNPLEFELFNERSGYGEVSSIVHLLTLIISVGANYKGSGKGEGNDKFWINAAERFMSRCIHLLRLSGEKVTIQNMRRILISSFLKEDVIRYSKIRSALGDKELDENKRTAMHKEYSEWIQSNYFLYVFEKANLVELNTEDQEIMHLVGEYFMVTRPDIPEKTLATINETFLGALAEPFLSGILKTHFSSNGVSPELQLERTYEEGKIVVVDFSPKTYGLSGVMASAIMKLAFQRCMENRDIANEEKPNPVFLWVDEYQAVVAPEYDGQFQATSRSTLCMTSYITQNINSIISVMGRYSPYQRAKALLGNLGLKIFCANGDIETNKYASEMIGQHLVDQKSTSINEQQEPSFSYSQTLLPKVPTSHFNVLKTGRKHNGYIVEAIVFKSGKKWKNGKNFIEAEFHQNNF